jgi:hypothetical protein
MRLSVSFMQLYGLILRTLYYIGLPKASITDVIIGLFHAFLGLLLRIGVLLVFLIFFQILSLTMT